MRALGSDLSQPATQPPDNPFVRPADRGDDAVVAHPIHDDEPDTGEAVVAALLAAECPQWARLPREHLRTSGTDNAMWRVRVPDGTDVVVRLPRRPGAAAQVAAEADRLHQLAASPLAGRVVTPRVLHVGEPHAAFPHRWSVLEWIDGTDAWTARAELQDDPAQHALASDLSEAVLAIRALTGTIEAAARRPGDRGGPIRPLVRRLEGWLDDPQWRADELIDVAAVRRLAAAALEVPDAAGPAFVHGDLIPGNLLVRSGRLAAILDWGGAGYGDPAQDLAPAWTVLGPTGRQRFRAIVGVDHDEWVRARTIELEHAVGGVLYYVPRRHPLGDVMTATLQRILTDG